jgi:hypothetical protein
MKNQTIFAILIGFMLFMTPAFADCTTPENDTYYTLVANTDICTDDYSNVTFYINTPNRYLNCNSSTFIGDTSGTFITIGKSNVNVSYCFGDEYESGLSMADSEDSYIHDNRFDSMSVYGSIMYRSNNTNFSENQITNTPTGLRIDQSSQDNHIYSNIFLDIDEWGILIADADASGNNIDTNVITNIGTPEVIGDGISDSAGANNTYIHGNTLTFIGQNAILLENQLSGNYIRVIENIIGDGTPANIGAEGIFVMTDGLGGAGGQAIISNNTVNGTTGVGIGTSDMVGSVISYNNVTGTLDAGIQGSGNSTTISHNLVTLCMYGMTVIGYDNNVISNDVYNSTQDGMGLYAYDTTITDGNYCDNNQTGGAWYDIYDDSGDNSYSGVLCDTSDPNGLCDHECGYVPPIPTGEWELTSTTFILIMILVTVALGMEYSKDTSKYEYLIAIISFVTIMSIAVTVVS